ncbi:MAG: hypothetical protein JWO67_6793 [Streptosporangiaceae bacterium]|nr:hypothetical protein [Streptosporangiaceae bacterium]
MHDTRKVQTAVIGSPDSDEPVILPMEPDDLETFRRQFAGKTFWCGTWLGGCGKELIDKLYYDRVCHFAHHSDPSGYPSKCERVGALADIASADHLYIKRDMLQWIEAHGIKASGRLYSAGESLGDVVELTLRTTNQVLRIQRSQLDYRSWQREEERAQAVGKRLEWVFGRPGLVSKEQIFRQGYALRLQCTTVGTTRRVQVGTELPGEQPRWALLGECALTQDGIATPEVIEVRRYRNEEGCPPPTSASLPLSGHKIHFVLADPQPLQAGEFHGRWVFAVDLKSSGSPMAKAFVSTPLNALRPSPQAAYRLPESAHVLLTPPCPVPADYWWIEAKDISRLDAHHAQASELLAAQAPPTAVLTPHRSTSAPRKARPAAGAKADSEQGALPTAAFTKKRARLLHERAKVFRQALESAARKGTQVTWQELAQSANMSIAHIDEDDRQAILRLIDESGGPGAPLLSALLVRRAGTHEPLEYLATIARDHGIDVPEQGEEFRSWAQSEFERVRTTFAPPRKPARTTPPTPPKSQAAPVRRVVTVPSRTSNQQPVSDVEARRAIAELDSAMARGDHQGVRVAGRRATEYAKGIRYGSRTRQQLNQAINEAMAWLKHTASSPITPLSTPVGAIPSHEVRIQLALDLLQTEDTTLVGDAWHNALGLIKQLPGAEHKEDRGRLYKALLAAGWRSAQPELLRKRFRQLEAQMAKESDVGAFRSARKLLREIDRLLPWTPGTLTVSEMARVASWRSALADSLARSGSEGVPGAG